MFARRGLGASFWGLWVALAFACGDSSGRPGGEWEKLEGPNVTLLHRPSHLVCPGNVGRIERLTSAIAEFLEIKAPPHLSYYYLPFDQELGLRELQNACLIESESERKVNGCARPWNASVYADRLALIHELVHVVAGEGQEPRCRFMSEGLATYLDFPDHDEGQGLEFEGLDDLFRVETPQSYRRVAVLVGYLVESFGVVNVMGFFRRCSLKMSSGEIDSLLREWFGAGASEFIERINAEGYLPQSDRFLCAGFAPFGDFKFGERQERVVDCGEGDLGDEGSPEHINYLEVPRGIYAVELDGEAKSSFSSCEAPFAFDKREGGNHLGILELSAGGYFWSVGAGVAGLRLSEVEHFPECVPLADGNAFQVKVVGDSMARIHFRTIEPVALPLRFVTDRGLQARGGGVQICDEQCVCEPLARADCTTTSCEERSSSVVAHKVYWLTAAGGEFAGPVSVEIK